LLGGRRSKSLDRAKNDHPDRLLRFGAGSIGLRERRRLCARLQRAQTSQAVGLRRSAAS